MRWIGMALFTLWSSLPFIHPAAETEKPTIEPPILNVTVKVDGHSRVMRFIIDGDLSVAAQNFIAEGGFTGWKSHWEIGPCSSKSSDGLICLAHLLVRTASDLIDEWLMDSDRGKFLAANQLNFAFHYNRGTYFGEHFTIGQGSYGWAPPDSGTSGLQVYCGSLLSHLIIGKFVSIGGLRVFVGCEHRTDWATTYPFASFRPEAHHRRKSTSHLQGHFRTKGSVFIGNDVWAGNDVVILSGVCIGDGAVLGANSVIAKDVPPYAVVAGNPAQVIRYRFDNATIARLLQVQWWNWPRYLIEKYAPLLSGDIHSFLTAAEADKTSWRQYVESARAPPFSITCLGSSRVLESFPAVLEEYFLLTNLQIKVSAGGDALDHCDVVVFVLEHEQLVPFDSEKFANLFAELMDKIQGLEKKPAVFLVAPLTPSCSTKVLPGNEVALDADWRASIVSTLSHLSSLPEERIIDPFGAQAFVFAAGSAVGLECNYTEILASAVCSSLMLAPVLPDRRLDRCLVGERRVRTGGEKQQRTQFEVTTDLFEGSLPRTQP